VQDVRRRIGLGQPKGVHADPRSDEFTNRQPNAFADGWPNRVTNPKSDSFTYRVSLELTNIKADEITFVLSQRKPDVLPDMGVLHRRRAEPRGDGNGLRWSNVPSVRGWKKMRPRPRLRKQRVQDERRGASVRNSAAHAGTDVDADKYPIERSDR
jgi:hypothetical protein